MSVLIYLIGLVAMAAGGLVIVSAGADGLVAMALGGQLSVTGVIMLGVARLIDIQRQARNALEEIAHALTAEAELLPLPEPGRVRSEPKL